MARQSISFTSPNDEWRKAQVESEEYSSKSEVVNDLIRRAREKQQQIQLLRAKLIKGENSGFIEQNPEDMLADLMIICQSGTIQLFHRLNKLVSYL